MKWQLCLLSDFCMRSIATTLHIYCNPKVLIIIVTKVTDVDAQRSCLLNVACLQLVADDYI